MIKYGKNAIFDPENLDPLNIDRQSVSLIPDNSRVLEIGCATGFVGKYLIKNKNCTVYGVDLGVDEAKAAKKVLTDVILGDIENEKTLKKIQKHGKFDVVYAAALIEHLRDPWIALKTWKKFLRPGGALILSTSNIAHWSTRINIFKGKFEYQQYGILDNTHLRFFTTHTFPKLVEDSGFTVEHFGIDAVGGGRPRISKPLSRFFPNLFAYQMVLKAKPA